MKMFLRRMFLLGLFWAVPGSQGGWFNTESNVARSVQMLLNTETLSPASTFELRFDDEMVAASQLGLPAPVSPLVSKPVLRGQFTWLSPRSGVFTPAQVPELGCSYEFSLRSGLRKADGTPLKAELKKRWDTPGFGIEYYNAASHGSNVPAYPVVRLFFYSEVNVAAAPRYLQFQDAKGRVVPAEANWVTNRGNALNLWYARHGESATLPWQERISFPTNKLLLPPVLRKESMHIVLEEIQRHVLNVQPVHALPPGSGWKLCVEKGLPAADGKMRTAGKLDIPLGEVQPFELVEVQPRNFLNVGRELHLRLSKPIASKMNPTNVLEWVELQPRPENLQATLNGVNLVLQGNFELGTNYQISLQPGFPAETPYAIETHKVYKVVFTPLEPHVYLPAFSDHQLSGGRRDFELLALNLNEVSVRVKAVDASTLIHALRAYRSYFPNRSGEDYWNSPTQPYRVVDYNVLAGRTIFQKDIPITRQWDQVQVLKLGWDTILEGRKFGAVFVQTEGRTGIPTSSFPGNDVKKAIAGSECLVQLTDLGMIWKRSPQGLWVWGFHYSTGKPAAGVKFQLLTDESELCAGKIANAEGMTRFDPDEKANWLLAQNGDDMHAEELSGRNQHELPLYRFRLPYAETGWNGNGREALVFTDRGVYRPGDTVQCKGLVRDWHTNHFVIPEGLTAKLAASDARGRVFLRTNLPCSAMGSFSTALALPPAPLGAYQLEVELAGATFHHSFRVEDYEPNAFQVRLDTKPEYPAGETFEAPVSAAYFLGKALTKAALHWNLNAWDQGFSPDGFEDFQFCGERFPASDESEAGNDVSLQGQEEYNGQETLLIKPALHTNPQTPQPRRFNLNVEITDLNQQTVSSAVSGIMHSSGFYLGMKTIDRVQAADGQHKLEIIAVGSDGKPWPQAVPVDVRLHKLDWTTVQIQGAGGALVNRHEQQLTRVGEWKTSPLTLRKVGVKWECDERQNGLLLPRLAAGEYFVELLARDVQNREVKTVVQFTVYGENETGWKYSNQAQVELVPDKLEFQPGETARIVVKAPFACHALVSVEREGVLRHFYTNLNGTASAVAVPIQSDDVPNIYVSVLLWRGFAASQKKFPMPETRAGYCLLRVQRPEDKLFVQVNTSATDYRPAQAVEVQVEIKDGLKQPAANAEVTLFAVDEGVLSLTGYQAPDVYGHYHKLRALAVTTALSLPNLLTDNPEELRFSNKGYVIGGGGDERGLRKKFQACAFWQAELHTDAQGRCSVSFAAPDSLTRYRVIAVAHTRQSQFGTGESGFNINKPLMLEPVLPRFANVGDTLVMGGLVHNQTDQETEVEVTLQLDDKAVLEGSPLRQTLRLSPKKSGKVELPVKFVVAGDARWIWRARCLGPAMDFTDAVQSTLKVGYAQPWLRDVVTRRLVDEATNLLAVMDPQVLAGQGTLTVHLANTRLLGLDEAVRQLLHYPYGCVEQTASSLLPWLVLSDFPGMKERLTDSGLKAEEAVARGINRILSMQTDGGGLSYWPGQSEPFYWGSAYGGLALVFAQKHGYELPAGPMDRLYKYLSEGLRQTVDFHNNHELDGRCLALLTLAMAQRSEPAYQEMLFDKREAISPENRAVLALAIAQSASPNPMAADLLQTTSRARAAALAQDFGFSGGERELAVRLWAACRVQLRPTQLEAQAEELIQSMSSGHWRTTQGNAWSLLALAEYARITEKEIKPMSARITFGTKHEVLKLPGTMAFREISFPWEPASARLPLQLSGIGDMPLYATVTLQTRLPSLPTQARDRGFAIQRSYQRVDDDGKLHMLTKPHSGDRVLVNLLLQVHKPAHYVAVVDELPAIMEAVNPAYKTSGTTAGMELASDWISDFTELTAREVRFFCDHLAVGQYRLQYLARVRASGTAIAPPARVEMMYRPERFGRTASEILSTVNSTP